MAILIGLALHGVPAAARQADTLHVLKIAAGPSGTQNNDTFVLSEERSVFNRSEDREVIVSFLWEGTPGPHKLAAVWRSQDGGTSSSSAMDYVAKGKRFGAFWRLTISPTAPTGTWSIETTVDGQPGGRFTFEITDSKVQPGQPVVAARSPLAQPALYERLGKMFVAIDRFSASGRALDSMAGVLGAHGRIYTSIAAVDDVDRLRGVLPGGSAQDLDTLLAWNRRQDWAVLATKDTRDVSLPVAAATTVKVGDRCYSMEGSPAAGGVLVDLSITGSRASAPEGGWVATFINGVGTPGAPVVNEFGELLGVVGASGATRMALLMKNRAELKGVPIVPFGVFRLRDDMAGSRIADLVLHGDLIPALVGEQNILSGGFARSIARTNTIAPSDQREEFAAKEDHIVAFVTWDPVDKLKGMAAIRLFDADNRQILQSQPMKLNLRKGQASLSSWELPISSLAGVYRADVVVDDKPMWRGTFRITP